MQKYRVPGILWILLLISNLLSIFGEPPELNHELKVAQDYFKTFSTSWPRYEATTKMLKDLPVHFPNQCQLYSIGQTVQGREMWVLKLGADINTRPLLVAPLKLVANMHGDETLGRALVHMFATDLLSKFVQGDKRAKAILENSEIHLLPSMNSDGFEAAPEGQCSPDPDALGRVNGNLKDLNRDFPDQFVTQGMTMDQMLQGRQPETINVMKWITSNYFVLSANFHALTVVASYPFDSVSLADEKKPGYDGTGVISKSPDHEVFFSLATLYSMNHKTMHTMNNCSKGEFKNGVINGAEWYNVRGGMQDFNYIHANTFEITFELSCCKFPPAYSLLSEWDNNREAVYRYVEAAQWGIEGIVQDPDGKPVAGASINVEGINHVISTTDKGEYWRLLLPGKYNVWASAPGYVDSDKAQVVVPENQQPGNTPRQDLKLKKK